MSTPVDIRLTKKQAKKLVWFLVNHVSFFEMPEAEDIYDAVQDALSFEDRKYAFERGPFKRFKDQALRIIP